MAFSEAEQLIAHEKFVGLVASAWSEWEAGFGPVESVSLRDMDPEEQEARLASVDETYVWADVEFGA